MASANNEDEIGVLGENAICNLAEKKASAPALVGRQTRSSTRPGAATTRPTPNENDARPVNSFWHTTRLAGGRQELGYHTKEGVDKTFWCSSCSKWTYTEGDMRKHVTTHKASLDQLVASTASASQNKRVIKYACKSCSFVGTSEMLRKHILREHSGKAGGEVATSNEISLLARRIRKVCVAEIHAEGGSYLDVQARYDDNVHPEQPAPILEVTPKGRFVWDFHPMEPVVVEGLEGNARDCSAAHDGVQLSAGRLAQKRVVEDENSEEGNVGEIER